MANDVEMNEVTSNLMKNESVKEPYIADNAEVECKSGKVDEEFTGLSKEELEKYAKDPFWRKLRLILFIIFWLVWLAMLVIAILIVVLSPKCPKRPKLEFWEKESGYFVDTMAFVDTNTNGLGDFNGLSSQLNYVHSKLGAGYIVLDPIFSGQYSNPSNMIGLVNSFRDVDPAVGDMKSFKKLIKDSRKVGLEIILSVDFNALHESSEFIKKNPNVLTVWNSKMDSWVSRDGKPCKRTFQGKEYYSYASERERMLDLDLRNKIVLKEIKESVRMWLDLGVRGFLLTNVAAYIENATIPEVATTYNFGSPWYKKVSKNGQIFSKDTMEFLKEIRSVMDEVAKKTDKSRLMILDSGNVGFGLDDKNSVDPILQYLDGTKIVDMVISREFLRNRGWNLEKEKQLKSSVQNYLQMTSEDKRSKIALVSATSTSLRTATLLNLAAPLLLPGNPIIYFGSEIGVKCNFNEMKTTNLPIYPGNHQFPLDDVTDEVPSKCNHMIMPWDNSGKIFYHGIQNSTNKYISSAVDTVQGQTAIGREETLLQLHQKLIKARNEPSLQWGNIKMILDEKTATSSYEIFVREANGFPKIIVALLEDSIEGKVFSLSSVCAKVVPLVVYPSNRNLPENKEVEANNIYLKISKKESIHVFKCV